jgi:rubrerythrin
MAAEEQEHAGMVERLLERTPGSNVDWDAIFEAHELKSKGVPNV